MPEHDTIQKIKINKLKKKKAVGEGEPGTAALGRSFTSLASAYKTRPPHLPPPTTPSPRRRRPIARRLSAPDSIPPDPPTGGESSGPSCSARPLVYLM